jgi:hypothetical protein
MIPILLNNNNIRNAFLRSYYQLYVDIRGGVNVKRFATGQVKHYLKQHYELTHNDFRDGSSV